jgi:hypothetical protein
MNIGDLIKKCARLPLVDSSMNDFAKPIKVRIWVESKGEPVDFDIKEVYYDDIKETFVMDTAGRMGADGRLINNGWTKIRS